MRFLPCLSLTLAVMVVTPNASQAGVLLPDYVKDSNKPAPNLGIAPSQEASTSEEGAKLPSIGNMTALPVTGDDEKTTENGLAFLGIAKQVSTKSEALSPGGTLSKEAEKTEGKSLASKLASGDFSALGFKSHKEKKRKAIEEDIDKAFSKIDAYIAKNEKPKQPRFYDETDSPNLYPEPISLQVTVAPKFIWGPKDTPSIENILGYKVSEIPQNCQIRLTVDVTTDAGEYVGKIYTGQTDKIGLSGTIIKSVDVRPYAVCNPPATLPPSIGDITRINGKYGLLLPSKNTCPLGKSTNALEIIYLGDGQVSCTWK